MSTEPDSDADLVRRSVAGDRHAFGALARRHGPRLARTVRALGVSTADVEDVVQNALVAAWRALADYDTGRPFLGWCSAIAINKARDWNRHRKVRAAWMDVRADDWTEAETVHDPAAGPAAEEDRDRLRRVQRALAAMPESLSAPLLLMTVGGLSQKEVAVSLDLSLKAVEARIARARTQLQTILARNGDTG